MKILSLFLFVLITTFVNAQQIQLLGTVVDSHTNHPIAAATISIVEKNMFYQTDNAGKFEISSNKIRSADSVSFSCIGYQTKKIKVNDLPLGSIVKLVPSVNMLHEVKVNTNLPALIKVGSKKKSGYELWQPHPGMDMPMFMEGSKGIKGIIKTVGFFLTNGHGMFKGGDATAPFRIRLFEVDSNGMPGREITKDSIIVSAKRDWAWFDADISAWHIPSPDSGFFVSFSLLDHSHYKRITKTDTSITDFRAEHDTYGQKLSPEESGNAIFNNPRICLTSNEFKQSRSYFYTYSVENNRWHWEKLYNNQSYMIRATIAPE
jgi:hypothetical protein